MDDGGFEIEALDGEPGVKSHRRLGEHIQDKDSIQEIARLMEGKPESERSCKLVLVIAVASPFGIMTSHGEIQGIIANEPSKKRIPGFPYGSMMYLPNYKKYYIELSDEEHEILNHRKHAVEKIHDIFDELAKEDA